jgi:hypothetical protein
VVASAERTAALAVIEVPLKRIISTTPSMKCLEVMGGSISGSWIGVVGIRANKESSRS